MAVTLYPNWRMSELAGGAGFDLTLDESPGGGSSGLSVTSTSAVFHAHYDQSSVLSGQLTLSTWLEAALTSAGSFTYGVTFFPDTGFYIIATGIGNNFKIAFNNAATRTLLGHTADLTFGAISYTSDQRVDHFIIARAPGISVVSDDYAAPDQSAEGEIDDGTGVSVRVGTTADYFDFSLLHELHAATAKHKASAAVPYTYQHFYEHVSSKFPFLLRDVSLGDDNILRLRAPRAQWDKAARERTTADWDGDWSINFVCRLLGRL